MKKYMKVIAMFLCMIVCMAASIIVIQAEECSHSRITYVHTEGYFKEITLVGTENVCAYYWYDNVPIKCLDCGEVLGYTNNFGYPTQHPTMYYNEETGKYYCPRCGYEK